MSLESLEFWKSLFEIIGVVLLLLTFIAGTGVLWFSRKLNAVQAEQLRQFDKGLTDAKLELGKQQERAANADARVAGLEQDVATATTEMAKQQARAATAERNLLEFQERFAPRVITAEQHKKLVDLLRAGPKGEITLSCIGDDVEGCAFTRQIWKVLKDSDWPPIKGNDIQFTLADNSVGQAIFVHDVHNVPPYAAALQKAFESVGIHLDGVSSERRQAGEVVVKIAHKPNKP